jgi:hypothetical protein
LAKCGEYSDKRSLKVPCLWPNLEDLEQAMKFNSSKKNEPSVTNIKFRWRRVFDPENFIAALIKSCDRDQKFARAEKSSLENY